MHFALRYVGDGEVVLQGFPDFDWARSASDKSNTSEYSFSLGSSVAFWFSKKLTFVAFNSAREKYMAASSASCEAIWPHK
jgi:hypothetical protein